jgi:hypothetical protein
MLGKHCKPCLEPVEVLRQLEGSILQFLQKLRDSNFGSIIFWPLEVPGTTWRQLCSDAGAIGQGTMPGHSTWAGSHTHVCKDMKYLDIFKHMIAFHVHIVGLRAPLGYAAALLVHTMSETLHQATPGARRG